jgi:hypothetical protein
MRRHALTLQQPGIGQKECPAPDRGNSAEFSTGLPQPAQELFILWYFPGRPATTDQERIQVRIKRAKIAGYFFALSEEMQCNG